MAEEKTPPLRKEEGGPQEIPLLMILEELHLPALLIDGDANLVGMTGTMRAVEGFSGCSVGKRPRYWDGAADERIRNYLQTTVKGPTPSACPPVPLVIDRDRRRPLVIKIVPIQPRPLPCAPTARAVAIVLDLETMPTPSPDLLRHIFDFTKAEARLASRLATGEGLAEAALSLGNSTGTARQQLKAIFAKTGCRRQSELMCLLARLTSLHQDRTESPASRAPQARPE